MNQDKVGYYVRLQQTFKAKMLKSNQVKMIVGLNNQKDIIILNFKLHKAKNWQIHKGKYTDAQS